jgi:hypothetical protein
VSGQNAPECVEHHIYRLHTPGARRLLDLELSGPFDVLPRIVCEAAGAHIEGSSRGGQRPQPEVAVEHRFTSETHESGHGHEEWLPPVRV